MANYLNTRRVNRRDFLKLGGGVAVGLTSASLLSGSALARTLLQPADIAPSRGPAQRAPLGVPTPDLYLAGTDGWVCLAPTVSIPPYHPDSFAPAPFTTYIFGFRNVTGMTADQVQAQKGRGQITAPIIGTDEGHDFRINLTNVGLLQRPDLFDSHTFHWHGFRNAIPFFDGEPIGSVSVPVDRDLTYYYHPRDPGTYLYHCHFEDSEHVHMGMTGCVYVRPAQNGGGYRYAYNGLLPTDPLSTSYDREFVIVLTDVWAEIHWGDAHIQLADWSDYVPDFFLMNRRLYPDTLAPNGGLTDSSGDLIAPSGHPELQYQPISSLIQCNAGDRVLLRMVNLSYLEQSMTLTGIPMRVVGKDATYLRGQDGVTDLTYTTDCVTFNAGESTDAIFVAPPHTGGGYDTYLLYNRNYDRLNSGGGAGLGGQMTEIRVWATGTLGPQTVPNT